MGDVLAFRGSRAAPAFVEDDSLGGPNSVIRVGPRDRLWCVGLTDGDYEDVLALSRYEDVAVACGLAIAEMRGLRFERVEGSAS